MSAAAPIGLRKRFAGLPVKDQIALQNAVIRRIVSYWIVGLFGSLNVITIVVIVWLAAVDQNDLVAKVIPANGRIVDTRVLISLLGATTVQLGTIAVIMARSVFND